jgi:hypothetical protein
VSLSATRTLERAYAALSGEERFRAAVLALSRDDIREVRRLVESCPTALYRLPETAFFDRWDGWRTLTAAAPSIGLVIRLDAERARLAERCTEQVAGWVGDMVEHAAWRLARQHGVEFSDAELQALRRAADARMQRIVAALGAATASAFARVAAWEASLDALAGELDLTPAAVRSALGEPPPAGDKLPEPDPDFYDAFVDLLHRLLR